MSELLPCPFCGGPAKPSGPDSGGWHWVMCCRCGVQTANCSCPEASAKQWNTRPQIPTEPTEAMIEAGINAHAVAKPNMRGLVTSIYKAMQAAASPEDKSDDV